MNLSQTSQQPKKRLEFGQHIGSGMLFLVSVVAVAGAIWGGLSYYDHALAGRVGETETRIVMERQDMPQDKIDSIADFQFRIDNIAAGRKQTLDPSELLGSLEGAILPGIRLTKYACDAGKHSIEIEAGADSFRTVVQQMTAFKRMSNVRELSAPVIRRNKEGLIDFSLSMELAGSPELP